jgi:MoaA/NifB/PqqE/SkfB family radical SAM enzyme
MPEKQLALRLLNDCNNSCRYCANMDNMSESCLESLKDLIAKFQSKDLKNTSSVLITGGETTLHPDLVRLIRFVLKCYDGPIILQTNAKTLDNHLEELAKLGDSIKRVFFAISLHYDIDSLDDMSTKCKKSEENIEKAKSLLGNNFNWHVATVLTGYNVIYTKLLLKRLIDLNPPEIKLTYPVLNMRSIKNIKELSVDYDVWCKQLNYVNQAVIDYPNIKFILDGTPPCVWINSGLPVHPHYRLELQDLNPSCYIDLFSNHSNLELNTHSDKQYKASCKECAIVNRCCGINKEVLNLYNNYIISPITNSYTINNYFKKKGHKKHET